MASQTDICNQALSHLAVGVEIASMTERSNEASACRRFYWDALRATLRDFPNWPFATYRAVLALVTDYTVLPAVGLTTATTQPVGSEWSYAYRYPNDCVFAKRILSGARQDVQKTRVPYRIGGDASGQLLLCDMPSATLEYTAYIDNPEVYPSDFTLAFALRLAIYIAPRLSAGDPFKLRASAAQLYEAELMRAKVNAANESQPDYPIETDSILARY